jgi:hypothetical protein
MDVQGSEVRAVSDSANLLDSGRHDLQFDPVPCRGRKRIGESLESYNRILCMNPI